MGTSMYNIWHGCYIIYMHIFLSPPILYVMCAYNNILLYVKLEIGLCKACIIEVLLGGSNDFEPALQSTENLSLRRRLGKSTCLSKKTPSPFAAKHPLVLHQNIPLFRGKTPSPFLQKVAMVWQKQAVLCQKEGMVLKARARGNI